MNNLSCPLSVCALPPMPPDLCFLTSDPCFCYNKERKVHQKMPKETIHPHYEPVHVHCACGNSFETRSTHKGEIHVEICSNCHPFFTGKQRLVDTAGRVERFRRKYAKSDAAVAAAK